MAKKSKENNYFNIFNIESSLDETTSRTEAEDVEEDFHSIIDTNESNDIDASDEHVAAQTTMFDNENFFSSATEDTVISDNPEEITEDISDTASDEVTVTDNESNIPSFSVEENGGYINGNSDEEEKLVSLLETNPLDDECSPQQLDFSNDESDPDIFKNIITYKELKKLQNIDTFETPYLYTGRQSDRIRYRLHLPSKNNPKANRTKKNMISWILTIVSAILIAVLLRAFVFVIATVDGPSMMPTLEHKEKLFVTKYSYKFSDIQRGDVVICRYGTEAYPLIYVKRVIGLGGEMVSIVDGEVYINGQTIEENYILDAPLLDMEPVYVPEGCVFVMGDNRNNSADSRKPTIGPLKEELIIGKVRFRVMPLNKFGSLEG